jgi:hypothetical protein
LDFDEMEKIGMILVECFGFHHEEGWGKQVK